MPSLHNWCLPSPWTSQAFATGFKQIYNLCPIYLPNSLNKTKGCECWWSLPTPVKHWPRWLNPLSVHSFVVIDVWILLTRLSFGSSEFFNFWTHNNKGCITFMQICHHIRISTCISLLVQEDPGNIPQLLYNLQLSARQAAQGRPLYKTCGNIPWQYSSEIFHGNICTSKHLQC